jgi:hypothetical protein
MVGISKGLPIELLRPLVADLESMHMLNRASGWQDFEAQALVAGLRACGEPDKGLRLLTEYAATYRRERWPLPRQLNEWLYVRRGSSNEADLKESETFRRAAV